MALTLYKPLRRMGWLTPEGPWAGEFDNLIDGMVRLALDSTILPWGEWRPAADIAAGEDGYTIRLALPGREKRNLSVTVKDGILTIAGENTEQKENGSTYLVRQLATGYFSRSYDLPEDAETAKIAADYKDGVLTVTVPRSRTAKENDGGTKIEIR